MSGKQIQSDEEYEKSLHWIRNTAAELADPLKDVPDRDKKLKLYDHISGLIQRYRRGELVQMFPGLRQVYAELGWTYEEPQNGPQEPLESDGVQIPIPTDYKLPEPQQEPERPKVNLTSWLDDDD